MKEYTSQELKDLIQINSDKKKNILLNWIDNEVPLSFKLTDGAQVQVILKFFTRYDYVVIFKDEETVTILAKHAVLWIDRV